MDAEVQLMKVTEHNITDWNLREDEIDALIHLLKQEIQEYPEEDCASRMFYGIIIGKLILMKNS